MTQINLQSALFSYPQSLGFFSFWNKPYFIFIKVK